MVQLLIIVITLTACSASSNATTTKSESKYIEPELSENFYSFYDMKIPVVKNWDCKETQLDTNQYNMYIFSDGNMFNSINFDKYDFGKLDPDVDMPYTIRSIYAQEITDAEVNEQAGYEEKSINDNDYYIVWCVMDVPEKAKTKAGYEKEYTYSACTYISTVKYRIKCTCNAKYKDVFTNSINAILEKITIDKSINSESNSTNNSTSDSNSAKNKPVLPKEYENALYKADSYANDLHLSKKDVYDQLTSKDGENFSSDAAQYAIDNVQADWNNNALIKARSYQNDLHMSINDIYEQLTASYGEQFSASEAQYAIDHLQN